MQYAPSDKRAGQPDVRLRLPRTFMIPDVDRLSKFPPDWVFTRGMKIYISMEHDVFYLSGADFPSRNPANPLGARLQRGLVRAAAPQFLRHRLAMFTEGNQWWEHRTWGCNLRWLWHAEKVALHAPTLLGRRSQFHLHRADRKMLLTLEALRVLYLVVPRDPNCHHGPHRHWEGLEINEDGFCTYDDFVAQHVVRQNSLPSHRRHRCNCYLDVDPTNGLAEWVKNELAPRQNPPEVVVVIEDVLR